MTSLSRRDVLAATALVIVGETVARAGVVAGHLPWHPDAGSPPEAVSGGAWQFFTHQEAAAIEVLADRIIPPDPETPGGKDAGCAVFIDRQLAGAYGQRRGLYTRPPFVKGSKEQGPQSAQSPAENYRAALAALDRYCQSREGGKSWIELAAERQEAVLEGLEKGTVELEGIDTKSFFETLLKDMQAAFFADPIYGGNRDMCAWKMIGFPGARYDYRDWVGRHNERYPYPPVSIAGRPDWTPKKS
jgi:gluconate 2-dehydrogenase gamma chain